MLGKEQMRHLHLVFRTVIEASAVLKCNLNVGDTAKSEYRPNQVNNKSRYADDKEKRELRHDTLSLTRKLVTHSVFWTPMETPY